MGIQGKDEKPFLETGHHIEHPRPLPDHLLPLADSSWAIWEWSALRGAGFPATEILRLVFPPCALAANELLEAEDTLVTARDASVEVLSQMLNEATIEPEQRSLLKAIRRHMMKIKLPQNTDLPSSARLAVETYIRAYTEMVRKRTAFEQAFSEAIDHQARVLRDVAQDPCFREALTWQNHKVVRETADMLLRYPPDAAIRTSKWRQKESLLARYLQRYCVKNDTIGFFGPVGWVKLLSQVSNVKVCPGSTLVAQRQVYFEHWAISTLAETFGKNKALRPWMNPRLNPTISLREGRVHRPLHPPEMVSQQEMAVLSICHGQQTAYAIAQGLLTQPTLHFHHEEEIYTLLERFKRMGLITWGFEIPVDEYPEQKLASLLQGIGDGEKRLSYLRVLAALEGARKAVAQAAGKPVDLAAALEKLAVIFTKVTGAPAVRALGKTYGARTLVYEDCRRNVDIQLGQDFLKTLGPPLSLLLTSARWFTNECCRAYYHHADNLYHQLIEQSGPQTLPFTDFWVHFSVSLYKDYEHILAPIVANLQERWVSLLSYPPETRQITYHSEDLRQRVEEAFHISDARFSPIPHHSPDILIAAASEEALRAGEYQCIMGELHVANNTLEAALFVSQHPCPEELMRAQALDRAYPRVHPLLADGWTSASPRFQTALAQPSDYHLAFTPQGASSPAWLTLPIGSLVIEKRDQGLVVCTEDRRVVLDGFHFIADLVSHLIIGRFALFPKQAHLPRISIDNLVVHREQWSFSAQTLTFAEASTELERFLGAQRLRRSYGLPRFVFVKTPLEQKPFYVDFESPILVDIWASAVRKTHAYAVDNQSVILTEMLPTFSQCWLTDSKNQRYTSELRMVATDITQRDTH